MHHVAYSNQINMVKGLLHYDKKELRTDPLEEGHYHLWLTARDKCGYTPIHIAAQFGSVKVFKALWGMLKPENFRHLKGCDSGDRRELLANLSSHNRTNDGQLSIGSLFLIRLDY